MASNQTLPKDNWKITTGFGIILVASDLIVLLVGSKFLDNNPLWIISATGIMTFFGILMISSYHKKNFVDHTDKGTMRDAITGSLISVYFTIIGFDMIKNIPTSSDSILNNFSSVIIILVAFYFGSKVVTEVYKIKNPDSGNGTTVTGK